LGQPQDHAHGHAEGHSHGEVRASREGHGHEHTHAHGHGHALGLLPSKNRASPLEAGAGRGKILFFDTQSGVAGDMTIAALLDLGVPWEVVESAVAKLPIAAIRIQQTAVTRGAIGATHFSVSHPPEQPHRSFREIRDLLRSCALEPDVLALSLAIFQRLAEAEAEVHRIESDEVQFHEVGAVDAIVDVVGAAACLIHVGARVLCSPLPMGSGSVMSEHGVLPLPAPATVNCLAGVPTYAAAIEGELVTPTGAAIVATVAESFVTWPTFAPERVGWGAGTRSLPDRPNALRVALGAPASERPSAHSHTLVEATVDDMTGELAAHALSALLLAGALDAWATAVVMKKGRPGLVLSALAPIELAGAVADVLLRETSTIGVRFSDVSRRELNRRVVDVETEFGTIPVKLSGEGSDFHEAKPEFDACVEAARRHGVPVRKVVDRARASWAARR
jgi:pyridinium-3,5-bisthiocarboxylic acid mononucleotide nickel chelatase